MRTRDRSILQAILEALEEPGGYVSGEDLSRRLGLSRAAVWKRIQTLRQEGYGINAKSRRGYTLVRKPDLLSPWEIGRNLKTQRVGREFHTFEEVTSTHDVAYKMALEGALEGVVVMAESQTQGRGRLNRSWISPAGKNLYLSLILRPDISPQVVPNLTYLGAVSTAEALAKSFSLKVELKWPNDVLMKGRKLAGLLNEVKAEPDQVDFVVLGFGVNLNMGDEAFPPELRETATSVMRELGHSISRVEFTRCLLESIEARYEEFLNQGPDRIIEAWEGIARIRGKFVHVRSYGEVHRGVAEGLGRDGALVLRRGEEKIRIVAGDLTETPM
jgi:BirA family biotin operon repressor/biotin-[acetyl-CoA-carboxylase] ligase